MSVRRLDPNQPENFEFTAENARWKFKQFAEWFPRFVYAAICIWMIVGIVKGLGIIYGPLMSR